MSGWPSVGVVLPTKDRPELLRRALDAVLAQDYPGEVRAVVVFDGGEPRLDGGGRALVVTNERTPGLAGARNTGVLALDTELVAFCDDDDVWEPGKLTAQVGSLTRRPDAEFASCAIAVDFGGRTSPRLAGRSEVTHCQLLRSRMVMVHSSTFLAHRAALLDGIGLLDESIPGSQNEDWDLALRAARRHPIVHVDEPLVRVLWGSASHFARQWQTKVESLQWMLRQHPDISGSPVGAGRVYAQIAFAQAALGHRGDAWRWARRSLRANWHERRIPFVLAVACGFVSADTVLRLLHARGHGI